MIITECFQVVGKYDKRNIELYKWVRNIIDFLDKFFAILFVIWSWPGALLGRSFWMTVTISDGEIGLAGRDMGKGEDKKEFTRSVWSVIESTSGWGEKVRDKWAPKRLAFSKSVIANELSGHSRGGIFSRWFVSFYVIFQREPLLGDRVLRYRLNCSDLYFANWVLRLFDRWLSAVSCSG